MANAIPAYTTDSPPGVVGITKHMKHRLVLMPAVTRTNMVGMTTR